MAAVDKIYGTYNQYLRLRKWITESDHPEYIQYMYPVPDRNCVRSIKRTIS